MDLSEREQDLVQGFSAMGKAVVSRIPGLGEAIAGWDAYKRSAFDRNVREVIESLADKIDNLEEFSRCKWLETEEGQQFARKVFDSAFDEQLADKQELFVNAFINGVRDQDTSHLEKLKYIDMLRQLSRAALMVLADMHAMFIDQVRGPNRNPDPISPLPLVDRASIAEKFGNKYHPYLVTATISEMESQGLFSSTGEWVRGNSSSYVPGVAISTGMCYTDFTARFVEFIKGGESLE